MLRFMPTWLVVASTLVASSAMAEPTSTSSTPGQQPAQTGRRIAVETPVEAFATPHAQISQTLYVERCVGGCTVNKGSLNDARTMTSTIPQGAGPFTVAEYVNKDQMSGTAADAEWGQLMTCLREVFSPFDVNVTDQKPAAGISHHVAIVAGVPTNIGQGNDILGIAPLAGDCSPQDNVISFSFANAHSFADPQRVFNLCWTAGQEAAHAFGLDHSYAFQDGRSSCNDPMTYRTDCGGQRFFRNDPATCGEFEPRMCRCGTNQNSHVKLTNVFGPGMAITGPPTSSLTLPLPNTPLGAVVGAVAGSKRGVARVELIINGYEYAEARGANYGTNGQPNPSNYTIQVPSGMLPKNSKLDVVARAYDDLGAFTDSAAVPSFIGSVNGCTDAAADCLGGQKCEAGKCFWDPPAGEIGDDCTFAQFCISGICQGTAEQQICTQACIPGSADSCPDSLDCVEQSPGRGICFFGGDGGGCCSVSADDDGGLWVHGGISLGLLGLLVFRRRRRVSPRSVS